MKWLLPLLLVAVPAFADEATLAASHHRDYPTSSLYLSPADASRFNESTFGILLEQTRSLSRADFVSGDENDDALARTLTLRLVRKASPSFYWGLALVRFDERDEANNTLITGDRKLATHRLRTEFGPEAAFKFMDKVVLGLGLKSRRVESQPDAGSALDLSYPVLESALLVRSEWYEAELAQRVLVYTQELADGDERQFRRELTLAVRYHTSATWTTGFRVTRNPVPDCCLVASSTRQIYALSAEIQGPELKSEVIYSLKPAYHGSGLDEVPRHGLAYTAFYSLSPSVTLQGTVDAERGEAKNSRVAIATASGTVEEANVEAFSWSLGFGATWAL